MKRCRIARRFAWAAVPRNTPLQATSGPTWVTKVFHLLLQSFPRARRAASPPIPTPGGLTAASEHRRGGVRRAGVHRPGNAAHVYRLAWPTASPATPLTTSSLATNGAVSEVRP